MGIMIVGLGVLWFTFLHLSSKWGLLWQFLSQMSIWHFPEAMYQYWTTSPQPASFIPVYLSFVVIYYLYSSSSSRIDPGVRRLLLLLLLVTQSWDPKKDISSWSSHFLNGLLCSIWLNDGMLGQREISPSDQDTLFTFELCNFHFHNYMQGMDQPTSLSAGSDCPFLPSLWILSLLKSNIQ